MQIDTKILKELGPTQRFSPITKSPSFI